MTQVGWAIRFVEDDNTMEHLNVLRKISGYCGDNGKEIRQLVIFQKLPNRR